MASVKPLQQLKGVKGIEKLAVQSSFIAEMEYDEQNLALTTHLKSGAIYQYKMVLPGEWNALRTAKNPSKFWADSIRGKKLSVKIKVNKSPKSEIKKHGRLK